MNQDSPIDPRQTTESGLTALLLGEMPHEQAAALHQKLAQDPEMAKLYERLKQTINLVRETVASPAAQTANQPVPLKLSDQRRQKLLQHFKTVTPREFAEPRRSRWPRLVELGIAAGFAVILGALLLPALSKAGYRGERVVSRWAPSAETTPVTPLESVVVPPVELAVRSDLAIQEKKRSLFDGHPAQIRAPVARSASLSTPAISTNSGIVLPQGSEPADAATATSVPIDLQPKLSVAAATKGFYEESLGRAAAAFGGGGTRNKATAIDNAGTVERNRQAGTPVTPPLLIAGRLAEESLTTGGEYLNYQRHSNASAQPGLASSDAEKLPVFGDVPAIGQLFRQDDKAIVAGALQKTEPYFEAKRQLEELQRFRQILDTKITSEKIDVELPRTGMVEIVDKAGVPQRPQSPSLWDRIRGKGTGEFHSSASVKVERDQSDVSGLADGRQVLGYDPYFVQTEFETIQSEAVLGKVIKDLNLNEAWGKKQGGGTLTTTETMALLKQKLDLQPVKNTSLINVGVKSDQPEEAAKIANAVAEAYKQNRMQQRKELAQGGIKAMEERFQEQEGKLKVAQANVDRLRRELKIPDAAAAGKAPEQDVAPRKPAATAPVPQPEVPTAENTFSTFSLNVSDVSFKLAGASLEKGLMPEPATVRSEEFINAFDYRDPEPPAGVPVAFAWERARYPFAQNRDLLRFSIKTAAMGRQMGRPLNLVLLLDNSGSMERADRVRIIHEALRVLAGQLQPQDKLSVVTFARTPRLWVDGVPGNQAAQVAEDVSGLTPQGGTNLEDALNLAYQTALRHYLANGVNRVVLLTDGAANLGHVDPAALKQKVEDHRQQGVALDCFGIGWEGYNDDLLEVLSRNGDGRYGFVNSPEEAATEFAGQLAGALHVAASDVKVQIEFNPARVTAYRQIGYAKHQLTKEQFRDNTVDAAEIAAAESGNALYAIEVNPRGDGPLATVRVRYKVPGTTDYHEHEWPVPYTGNAVALEQASPAMRLAAVASAFSEWLVSSPYAAEVTPDRLLACLGGVPEVSGADARPRKLEWMIRQAKSIAGK